MLTNEHIQHISNLSEEDWKTPIRSDNERDCYTDEYGY